MKNKLYLLKFTWVSKSKLLATLTQNFVDDYPSKHEPVKTQQ